MAVRTKVVRIFEADERALGVIAGVEHLSKAEVVRRALHEYMQNHRAELEGLFHETRKAIAAGDVDRLLALSAPGNAALVDAAMKEIEDLG
jgi:hypothetical protein